MEVQCPDCSSKFHLADNVAKPGAKLRCSKCKHVFTLPNPSAQQNPAPVAEPPKRRRAAGSRPPEESAPTSEHETMSLDFDDAPVPGSGGKKGKKKSKSVFTILFLLLILGACAGGAWWYMQQGAAPSPEQSAERAQSVALMTMRDVRQYYVDNEKIGPIFVLEGKVVNQFPDPKEFIEVQATIHGKSKKNLISKTQLAGTSLSLFQMQVLGKEELESSLSNQIEILTRNTNVPSGGEVPFMVLFYDPPADVTEFTLKILQARDVETP